MLTVIHEEYLSAFKKGGIYFTENTVQHINKSLLALIGEHLYIGHIPVACQTGIDISDVRDITDIKLPIRGGDLIIDVADCEDFCVPYNVLTRYSDIFDKSLKCEYTFIFQEFLENIHNSNNMISFIDGIKLDDVIKHLKLDKHMKQERFNLGTSKEVVLDKLNF